MLWRIPPKNRLEYRMWQGTLNGFVWCRNLVADCPVILEATLALAGIWVQYSFVHRFRICFHTQRFEMRGQLLAFQRQQCSGVFCSHATTLVASYFSASVDSNVWFVRSIRRCEDCVPVCMCVCVPVCLCVCVCVSVYVCVCWLNS